MGLCAENEDACHAQLSARYGATGGKWPFYQQHLWWWISIGTQDYVISGTASGGYLNTYVAPGTQSRSNPEDGIGNGTVIFDTRDAHGGFASPADCAKVMLMLSRALHLQSLNNFFAYDPLPFIEMTSNTVAHYVGWPYGNQIRPPSNVLGWGTFLPEMMNGVYTGVSYPNR